MFVGHHLIVPAICLASSLQGAVQVVQVTYDTAAVSFEQLLALFWEMHDPTDIHSGDEVEGTQYR